MNLTHKILLGSDSHTPNFSGSVGATEAVSSFWWGLELCEAIPIKIKQIPVLNQRGKK